VAQRWSDHYTRKAKNAGYGARSVFKLEEIQRRTAVIRRGCRAVDLGCYPGSWSRYLVEQGASVLVGVDFQAPEGIRGHFIEGSALEVTAEQLLEALGGPADLLVSDMAPKTTGNRHGDHLRQLELAQRAFELACEVLMPGGAFVTKLFEGPDTQAWVEQVKPRFGKLRRIKPDATRKQSVELFLVATGFRPPAEGGRA
jgi:23S rRNA (uridine2552-2'-O)-methyltransferase